ncbi:stage II sporulation protein M [Brevibacterium daeguense]|uniref:Stage II sporulation protein M n=1 Tax=Brevibacterium daeguense TaxID=909936 RepID=A0ABP8EMG3_9MICO|nr:stage II sporulation protein M [Brevibacterium daeguense]
MDPALLAELHGPAWDRLSKLAKRNSLSAAEAEEFLWLYRSASKDLSRIRTVAPDSEVSVRLSNIVHRSRMQLTGVPQGFHQSIVQFFTVSLPAALYSTRWMFLAVFVFFVGLSVATTVWAHSDPQVLGAFGTPQMRRQLAEEDFVDYYFEHPNGFFAVGVWANNAWIAVQWVALGITGIYVIYGLIVNAVNVGLSGAIMFEFDQGADFFRYILPHGIPEITCILIAAAAGLKIFTAWVVPGPLPRRAALARAARSLITVALGLVLFLFLSGLVEGFITPSSLPDVIRIGTGVLLTAAIFAYAIALGRPALAAGDSGDLAADRAGFQIVAAD